MTAALAAGEPAVRLRGVTKRFGTKTAVDDVTLSIRREGAFGLIGPNGAGKTTTFSMIAGYVRPTSGSIEVLGLAPTATSDLRSRVGVLPQDALLPAGDRVGDLLVHFARLQGAHAAAAADVARRALSEVEGADWWSRKCGALSHGMTKRVALAQAFLGDPELVLLDEPTAGLDPRAAWEVRRLIEIKRGRCAVVVSSHNLQELEAICDAAAILDGGRLVAGGSMAELTSANDEVRVLLALGARAGNGRGEVPLRELRELPGVASAEIDADRRELVVRFDRRAADAETVIARVLPPLLDNEVRISGVAKGRGLEQRVLDLVSS